MTRTVVSFDPTDKECLDRMAKERDVPMTQVVREAARRLRKEQTAASSDFRTIHSAGTMPSVSPIAFDIVAAYR